MSEPEKYAYDMLSAEIRILISEVFSASNQGYPITPLQAANLSAKVLEAMTTAFKLGHTQGKVDMEKIFMDSVPKLAKQIVAGLQAKMEEINGQGSSTDKSI